jgi:repressor LexA
MGHIKRSGHVSRGIRLVRPFSEIAQSVSGTIQSVRESVQQVLSIPVMGRIFASEPVHVPPSDFPYLDAESVVSVARSMLPAREKVEELFALEVNGDSMIDAMVNDGDIVIMKPAKDVHNGDLVAIWLRDKDETTLKYFFLEDGKVRLQPANPTMKPIFIDDPSTVDIQGKIVMIIRPCEIPLL